MHLRTTLFQKLATNFLPGENKHNNMYCVPSRRLRCAGGDFQRALERVSTSQPAQGVSS